MDTGAASITSLYESLCEQYIAMAEAAEANEWERLTALEFEARALRKRIQDTPGGVPEAESERVATVIRRILELDEAVRTHAEPFLESTRKLLAGTVQSNNVRKAYGAFGP